MAVGYLRSGKGTDHANTPSAAVDLSDCSIGDFVLVLIGRGGGYAEATSVPSGWELIESDVDFHSEWLYAKILTSGDIGTVTWTFGYYGRSLAVFAAYSGHDSTTPIAMHTSGEYLNRDPRKTLDFGSVTTDCEMIVALAGFYADQTTSVDMSSWSGDGFEQRLYEGSTISDHWCLVLDSDGGWEGGTFAPSTSTTYLNNGNASMRAGYLVVLNPSGSAPAAVPDLFLDGVWG